MSASRSPPSHANRRAQTPAPPPPPRLCSPLHATAAASPLRRCSATSHTPLRHRPRAHSPPLARSRATHARATLAPPTPHLRRPYAAAAPLRRRLQRQHTLLTLPRACIQGLFKFSPPLIQVHTRCSRNCLLGCFFDFFSTESWICKGMVLLF